MKYMCLLFLTHPPVHNMSARAHLARQLGRLLTVQWQALGATSAGLGFFAALYSFASWVDKPSKVPFVSLSATSSAV